MKRNLLSLLFTICIVAGCVKDRVFPYQVFNTPSTPNLGSRTNIHYWNFNGGDLLKPTFTTGGGALSYVAVGLYDAVSPGSDINARNGDAAGSGLRLRNPAGTFTLNVPTTYFKDILFSFAAQRSGSGAQQNILSYSIDGSTFINDGLRPYIHQLDTVWQGFTYDFSAIAGANDNPNFKIRINFSVNDTGISGNDRFDNIALDGNLARPIPPTPPVIIHYWNFNLDSLRTPTFTIGGADMSYAGAAYDAYTPGSVMNARNGDTAGNAIRLRNPAGPFIIKAPTTNYKNIKLTMEVQRSSSGAATNSISYTIDGINYITTGLPSTDYVPADMPNYNLVIFSFAGIAGVENNPNFAVKIEFSNIPPPGTSGNNRFDNIVFEGNHL